MIIKVQTPTSRPTYYKPYKAWTGTSILVPVEVEKLGNQAIHHS